MFSVLRSGLRPVGPVWQGASWLIALGVFAPIASLAWLALGANFAHWRDLLRYVLPEGRQSVYIASLCGIAAGMLFNFLGSRYVVFRKRHIRE